VKKNLALSTIVQFWRNHFFNPDSPEDEITGFYSKGLLGTVESSYVRSRNYWIDEVLPLYIGKDRFGKQHPVDQDQAYYYLGRTAHLLEDAAQPSHVLMDPHIPHELTDLPGDSILEEFTANAGYYNSDRNFYHWNGVSYVGDQYNYENLIPNFNWSKVEPTDTINQQNIDFFKLFWYTAQKTSYFASDDKEQDFTYEELDGTPDNWDCSGTGDNNLWKDQYTSCSNFIQKYELISEDLSCLDPMMTCSEPGLNEGPNIAAEADAVVPHAMKSVAGLYRLFWNTVRYQLQLDPTNANKQSVRGGVAQDGTWQTELNVSRVGMNNVQVQLVFTSDPCSGNDISLNVTKPSGVPYLVVSCDKPITINNPDQGMWTVAVHGNSVFGIHEFEVQTKMLSNKPEDAADQTAGINFTFANLNYISTCNPQDGFVAVMKGMEANTTETIINITDATVEANEFFLTALAIPDHKMWVTMVMQLSKLTNFS